MARHTDTSGSHGDLDVVVIGGGIQGLLALEALVEKGYACALVSNGDLGLGQTLHSHGFFNAGFGMLGPELPSVLNEVAQPYLQQRGIELSADWVLIPPPGFPVEHLQSATVPPGFAPSLAEGAVRLPERSFPKRRLVEVLSQGRQDRILRGHATLLGNGEGVNAVGVRLPTGGEDVILRTKAVVVAAGCGSKRLLQGLVGQTPQTEQIKHRRVHMIVLRAPRGSLPIASLAAMPLAVLLAAHDQGDNVTWYATPMEFGGPSFDDIPEDAASDVDPEMVVRGCTALLSLYPGLPDVEGLQAGCYAGYRQDIGDIPGIRACELVDGANNVIMALPSGLVASWLNVVRINEMVGGLVDPSGDQPPLPAGGVDVRVGAAVEDRPEFVWMSWKDWLLRYPQLSGQE